MRGSLVPGTPVHALFPPSVNNDPLTGSEPNGPRSPKGQNNPYGAASPAAPLCPRGIPMDRVPFYSSLIWIDERIHLQMDQEEATAARRIYEVNQYHLHEERKSALRRELGEIQFEEELSLQAQQHLSHWEQEEAATFTARTQAAESNIAQAATSRLLMVEEEAIRHHQRLRQSLTQAKHSYRATVQQEARIYSEELSQELLYHQTAQEAETSLLREEEGISSLPAIPEQVQGTSSPLTPPVLQSQPLLARHLSPQTLPFQNFASRVAETAQEEEVAEEQQAALRVLQESEEQASRSRSATDELDKLVQPFACSNKDRWVLELHLLQADHWSTCALPASNTRAPWAATRERLQHHGSAPSTPLLQQQGLSSDSSGLPSLSGVCSVPGVACPVYASPSPHTPHACLYPNPGRSSSPTMDLDGFFAESFTDRFTIYRTYFYLLNLQFLKPSCVQICVTIVYLTRSNPWLYKRAQTLSLTSLYLTFQACLHSEPSARVEGLATIEAPVKPARAFGEALSFLRSWSQQVLTVVNDLGGNPEHSSS